MMGESAGGSGECEEANSVKFTGIRASFTNEEKK